MKTAAADRNVLSIEHKGTCYNASLFKIASTAESSSFEIRDVSDFALFRLLRGVDLLGLSPRAVPCC